MGVASSLPRSLSLLLLALPWVYLAGRDMARWLTWRRSLRAALAPGLALALWILSVHFAGKVTRSFFYGLSIGTASVALIAIGRRVLRPGEPLRFARPPLDGPSLFRVLLFVTLVSIPVAEMAFGWAFHDEYMYTGHMSIPAEMQNDIYPPRHLTFADTPLRYHYGFDLVTASISAILRVPVETAIDIAAVLLWAYAARLLFALGDLWFGRGRGAVAALMTLFTGGVPACFPQKGYKIQELISVCEVKGLWTLPPLISSFFQHPWALGLPIALASLLVFSAWDRARRWPRYGALWLLFTALSIGHFVLFITFVPSMVAAELYRLWVRERRPLVEGLGILVVAAAALGGAFLMGGFFASQGGGGLSASVVIKPGVVDGFSSTLLWLGQSFGFALPLALIGLWLVPPRGRVVTALLLFGCLLVLNTCHYLHSWDIVKFGTAGSLAVGLAGAAVVSRVLGGRRRRGFVRRLGRATAGASLVVVTTCAGFAFALFFFAFRKDVPHYFSKKCCAKPSRDDARAASFIRKQVHAGEIVFRREGPASGYAQYAGLPVPWLDWGMYTFGFPTARTEPRAGLLKELPADPERYLEQGIDWFVLEPSDTQLVANADRWIQSGRAAELARYGKLRVVKLAAQEEKR